MPRREIDNHMIDLAIKNNFDVVKDLELEMKAENWSLVDVVALFDVLEHIPRNNLIPSLLRYKALLKQGGCIIARVPNGDSPFGLFNQNGDITHCNAIGSQMIPQISVLVDMEIVFVGPEALPIFCGSLKVMLHRIFQIPFRYLVDIIVRLLFYPKSRACFTAPNITFVLKKR